MSSSLLQKKNWQKAFAHLKILSNPSDSELRTMARPDEQTMESGAPAYYTRMATVCDEGNTVVAAEEGVTLGRFQTLIDPRLARAIVEHVKSRMPGFEWLSLDRMLGDNPDATFRCRLLIPKGNASIACIWSRTLFPAPNPAWNSAADPDFLTICLPEWPGIEGNQANRLPRQLALTYPETGVTFVLGFDAADAVRMSFIRQALHRAKCMGGLGLCAGSKLLRFMQGDGTRDCGILLFGGPSAMKSMLLMDGHRLAGPECASVFQKDFVILSPRGRCFGTENDFFVPTCGITLDDQPALYNALMSPEAIFENVARSKGGRPPFDQPGNPGRAVMPRSRIAHTAETVDMGRVDKIVFLTRGRAITPPLTRPLSAEQAAAFFMLGENAGETTNDPSRVPAIERMVGFNPAIIGLEDAEGNRFLDLMKAHPSIETYIFNVGTVGHGADAPGRDPNGIRITSDIACRMLEFIARQEAGSQEGWVQDRNLNPVPKNIPAIRIWDELRPEKHYKPSTLRALTLELRTKRARWIEQFHDLNPAIVQSVPGF
ncbi:MAG: phosphoenolpyruvate carboxykinase (ATP) [Elusimicrobiota bacterium]